MNPAIQTINANLRGMFNDEGALYGHNFKTRTSDVFVVTYPKCGTTWVTQICHQLRSGGHMNFNDLGEVVVWDVMAKAIGQDLDADQLFEPRVFKSHETPGGIAKGGKYLIVVRDPLDAFISKYNYILHVNKFSPEDATMEEFHDQLVLPSGIFSQYYADWFKAWKNQEAEIMWVSYEDLKEDINSEVLRIAKFMDLPEAELEAKVKAAMEMSTMEFMKQHKEKFAEEVALSKAEEEQGLSLNVVSNKINKGQVGRGLVLPNEVKKKIEDEWKKYVGVPLGLATYADFRKALKK